MPKSPKLPKVALIADPPTTPEVVAPRASGHATAKRAAKFLEEKHGFVAPSRSQRTNIAMAFAAKDKVVYGKAYDLIRITEGVKVDLDDLDDVRTRLADIVLYEVKSTAKKSVKDEFRGYFFSLTTAELLVAQTLGDSFRFAFVHMGREVPVYEERTLREVYSKARAIYPTWSIQF